MNIISRKGFRRCVSILLCFTIMMMYGTTVFAAPASGASESAGIGTSMYDVSTALTAYANSVVGSNTNDKHNDHKLTEIAYTELKPGVAGAMIGYGDPKKDFYAYISSNTAKSVTTSSYDAWLNAGDDGGIYSYARYGYLLADLGLDETATSSTTASSSFRNYFGLFMYAVHAGSGFVPKVFDFSVGILRMLNPFQFFLGDGYQLTIREGDVVTDVDGAVDTPENRVVSTENNAEDAYGSSLTNRPAVLQPLRDFVTELYGLCQSIGLFVAIPLLIGFFLAFYFLKKEKMPGETVGRIKVFLIRLVFICVGIPFLGVMYTSVLDDIGEVVQDRPAGSRLVACTFVDFQTWVQESRLSLPTDVELVSVGKSDDENDSTTAAGSASADTVRQLRETTFQINKASGLVPSSYGTGLGGMFSSDPITAGMWDTTTGTLVGDTKDAKMQKAMSSLLNRYHNGGFYQASAWETAVNGMLTKNHASELGYTPSTSNADSNNGMVYEMYDQMDECSDWLNREIPDNTAIFDDSKWSNFNIVSNGNLEAESTDRAAVDGEITYKGGTWAGETAADPKTMGGLSSLAMYNYLSTDFGDSAISVYSAVNSTSEYTKHAHFSVDLIGSGVLRILYALNCLAALGIFVIIGFVYGLGMMIGNIKRGISLIMQIPMAMVGVMKSIVQIIVYVLVMCIELLGTVFVYQFVCDLIVMFASLIEQPILDSVNSATSVVGGNFALVGVINATEFVKNSVGIFTFGFAVILLGLLFIGKESVKRRRVVLTAYEYMMCRTFRFMTFDEFVPVFDAWMKQKKSLYIWDMIPEVVDDVQEVLKTPITSSVDVKGVSASV